MKALYKRKDMFMWLLRRFGNSTCCQILPFVSDHELGPIQIRSGKSIGVLVISLLVSLIIDHVQKPRLLSVKASIISSRTGKCSSGSIVTGN